ncbi:MAG TPA: Phenylacetic acid catabolic protein [Candidatus Thermoplasmatota archaeon]|nr:Phenylacetic acid catabolic protein [Candidatus Thermoplasmatota archaeon]
MAQTIQNFDDWIAYFRTWQKDIGYSTDLIGDFKFEAKFADLDDPKIQFGDYKGQEKWKRYLQVPNQQIRDALLHLIVYQGDTEFASVEQQRHLLTTAPTDYDLKSALRINAEEMRHGWQMCHLLVNYFGDTGKVEAQKMLERRAFEGTRLLGAFNEPTDHWLDFFIYTQFVDRDGKYQLKMLSHCAFAPLAQSMGPMLKEESFHLGTGNSGLQRILRAGKIPTPIMQRYFNKWVPTAYDLFGKDGSTTSYMSYVWGLKARYNETETNEPVDKDRLNQHARGLYEQEIRDLCDKLNILAKPGQPKLLVPNVKFNRKIGEHMEQSFTVEGEPIAAADYKNYLAQNLPTKDDQAQLKEIFAAGDWIAPKAAA